MKSRNRVIEKLARVNQLLFTFEEGLKNNSISDADALRMVILIRELTNKIEENVNLEHES